MILCDIIVDVLTYNHNLSDRHVGIAIDLHILFSVIICVNYTHRIWSPKFLTRTFEIYLLQYIAIAMYLWLDYYQYRDNRRGSLGQCPCSEPLIVGSRGPNGARIYFKFLNNCNLIFESYQIFKKKIFIFIIYYNAI